MKPKKNPTTAQDDFFKVRLDDRLCPPPHELVKLTHAINWNALDQRLGFAFAQNGAPALASRLISGLMYLQHTFNLSDELVCLRWRETPLWQYFCGREFFEHALPCDPSSLSRWRKRIGEEGLEWLLAETIEAAKRLNAIKPTELKRIVVDTTVQEKNIAHPVDSKLYDKSRRQLVDIAHTHGITLRQTYQKSGRTLLFHAGRYGHARQYKRMGKAVKQLKNILGRVERDLSRQLKSKGIELSEKGQSQLSHARRLIVQTKKSKGKLYSLHEPKVDCISKGKARKRYEFGVKASFATTHKGCWVVGARRYAGNPYDGHTLEDQIQQVETLLGESITDCYVDRGYKGHSVFNRNVWISGQKRGVSKKEAKRIKRRSSIEPIIGHMKADGRARRCFLKGVDGDAHNVLLVACGQNMRKLLKWLRTIIFGLKTVVMWRFLRRLIGEFKCELTNSKIAIALA